MVIGLRLRQLRKEKNLTQRDIEESTGLTRCYVSRVEHGSTVPSLETLHRFAAGLDVPLYRIFHASESASGAIPVLPSLEELAGESGPLASEARLLLEMKDLIGRMDESARVLLLDLARRLAGRAHSGHGHGASAEPVS